MEWLLVLMFSATYKGGIVTERVATEAECIALAKTIETEIDDMYLMDTSHYQCIQIKKLEK